MKKRLIICILVIFTTLIIIFYKTRPETANEEIDFWKPNSSRNVTDYIHSNSNLPPNFCQQRLILTMVHSEPWNFGARITIRRTWKQEDKSVYFLIGETLNDSLQMQISEERRMYGDIIQANFIDSYMNLTLKSVVMLQMAAACNKYKYLLKSDDDTLVSLHNIKEALFFSSYPKELLVGHLVCDQPPNRNPSRKGYAPYYMYPGETYPRYLIGGAYLMSMSVVRRLYQAALETPIFHLENIFITGLCAQKAGTRPEHSELFSRKHVLKKGCLLRRVSAIFDVTIDEMRMYHAVLKTYYRVGKNCFQQKPFSALRWFLEVIFGFSGSPFGYRRTCK